MAKAKGPTVRTVFGKEIEIEKLVPLKASQYSGIEPSLLKLENEDPEFTYAWLEAGSPETSRRIRKNQWELVDPATDPVIAAGATEQDKAYRVNELILARQPKEMYEARKAAARARHIHREMATEEQFKAMVSKIAGSIVEGETGEPVVVKEERVARGRTKKA